MSIYDDIGSKLQVAAIISGMVAASSSSVLLQKYMSSLTVHGQRFQHPYIMTLIMFLSESTCLVIYLIHKRFKRGVYFDDEQLSLKQGKSLHLNYFALIVPVLLDLAGSTLRFISVIYLPLPLFKLLVPLSLIATAIYSRIFIQRPITQNQYAGIFFIVMGLILVAASAFVFGYTHTGFSVTVQAVALVIQIFGQLFNGGIYVAAENIFNNYYIPPLKMVAIQGLWGLLFGGCVVALLQFIPCEVASVCVADDNGNHSTVENIIVFGQQLAANSLLLGALITQFFIFILFNVLAQSFVKHVSAIAQAANNILDIIVVWVASILVTYYCCNSASTQQDFCWESLTWPVIVMEVIAFLLIIFGTLTYNGAIWIFIEDDQKKSVLDFYLEAINKSPCYATHLQDSGSSEQQMLTSKFSEPCEV